MLNVAWASNAELPAALRAFEEAGIVVAGIAPSKLRAAEQNDGAMLWDVIEYTLLLRPQEATPPNPSG